MAYSTDPKGLLAAIRANYALLDGCAVHKFTAEKVRLGDKLPCQNCGGMMGLVDIGNYIRGYEAAGKDGADIWPAYKATMGVKPK